MLFDCDIVSLQLPLLFLTFSPPLLPLSSGGKTLSSSEYKAQADQMPLSQLWTPNSDLPKFEQVMAFKGAPEIINGRLAMMGFVAAVAAELSSGEEMFLCLRHQLTSLYFLFEEHLH